MRFLFVLLFLVNFNGLAWSRPQNTNPDLTQDNPKAMLPSIRSFIEKSQFRWNVTPSSLVVNTPKPINVTSHFIDTDWTHKIIHEVVNVPNHDLSMDEKPIYLTNNPTTQDKWTFHFESPHEDIKESALFPQGDIFELISLLEMETGQMRTSTKAPETSTTEQTSSSTDISQLPSHDLPNLDPLEALNQLPELEQLAPLGISDQEPELASLEELGISTEVPQLPSFDQDQLPEDEPSRPIVSRPVSASTTLTSGSFPNPSPSNNAGSSFNPIGAVMSVSAVSAATALYGVAATLPVWLPAVLGRRKKRNVFIEIPFDPNPRQVKGGSKNHVGFLLSAIKSLVQTDGVKNDNAEKTTPNQDKVVNHIKGLLNGIVDSDNQGMKNVSPEGDINNALSPIKTLDAMKETIQATNTLKSEKNHTMSERNEQKDETNTTENEDKTETTTPLAKVKASETTFSGNTIMSTTTTTTSTTTTTKTTTRTTTRTTTTTTTTTTTQPIQVTTVPPGMLARIGSMVQGSMDNLGSKLVAGSSFLAAAASPILFQLVLGKKKRRKRTLMVDDSKLDDILSRNSRFLQPANPY